MIPGWKVRRELLRFQQQIAWYWELLQARRRTRRHDQDRPRLVTRTDGHQMLGSKVAALLIFQPGTMPASIPEQCQMLTELGYSVLIISNCPLRPEVRAALLPLVWRVLERPNLGYDFGGYREGVMHLWDEAVDPDELLILNDSVWIVASAFPAFLDRLRAMGAEVTGSVLRSKKGRSWIESYFFRFEHVVLTHSAFRAFWRDYLLIDSKFGVIRQGERDFTIKLAEGGLRVCALGDNPEFIAQMARASDEDLRIALAYAAPVTGDLAQERAHLLAAIPDSSWRARVLAHFRRVLDGRRIWHSQFPVASLRVMGFPFVKKSREPVNYAWREQVLRGLDAKVFPALSKTVLDELAVRQNDGASQLPPWVAPKIGKFG